MTDDSSWLVEAQEHLEAALDAEDPSQKNYHVRGALQQLTVKRRERDE